MKNLGQLLVITGPSGVGKGTLVRLLLSRHSQLFLSISITTRSPRDGEIAGRDYHFVTVEEFQSLIAENQLLEWAEYAGNYYGTPRQPVVEQMSQGKTVLLEIEVVGAKQVKQNFPSAQLIFILPPSFEELERRLRGRGNDSESAIEKRLNKARQELLEVAEFNWQFVNDDLEMTLESIESVLFSV